MVIKPPQVAGPMRIVAAAPVAVALLAALLSGCFGDATDAVDPLDACPASPLDQPNLRLVPTAFDPIDDNRDNATFFESTNVRTCSLPAIGWSPLDPSGTPHRYLGELDLRGDLHFGAVAVVGNGEPARVYLVDITNRQEPQVITFIDQPTAYMVDVKISDDGKILYVASQNVPGPEFVGQVPTLLDPELVPPVGFTAYNIEDPSSPAYLGFVADENGCHMLDPIQVAANQDAVMCISGNLKSYLIQRDGPTLVNLGFVEYFPNNAQGIPVPSTPVGLPADLPVTPSQSPHDMTAFHEGGSFGAGNSYLVVSHWGEGVKVLDITAAPVITEVGSWDGAGATHYAGNVHTAMMFMVGEQRFIVASPEYTFNGAVPSLWVLDANDLGDLKLVAEWSHPNQHESQGLYLTTHQWQVAPTGPDVAPEDVRIYLTYNHAGVWVLDFGQILAADDQAAILGFNLARTPIPEDHVGNAVLSTWDVNVVDGYIYGTDRATGLWVFHYLGDELGDARLRGFA